VKSVERAVLSIVFFALAVTVLASELPKLVIPVAVIVGMSLIGRVVWFLTRRW
jgi:hypothetical protein